MIRGDTIVVVVHGDVFSLEGFEESRRGIAKETALVVVEGGGGGGSLTD